MGFQVFLSNIIKSNSAIGIQVFLSNLNNSYIAI